ncbi:MAG: hypothetical protein WCD70_15465, partial [Alphaproteobacteria bacterium]
WQWAVLVCAAQNIGVTRAYGDTAEKLTENGLATLIDGVVIATPNGEEAVRELQRKGVKFDIIPSPAPEDLEGWLSKEYRRLTDEIHTEAMNAIDSKTIFADEEWIRRRIGSTLSHRGRLLTEAPPALENIRTIVNRLIA